MKTIILNGLSVDPVLEIEGVKNEIYFPPSFVGIKTKKKISLINRSPIRVNVNIKVEQSQNGVIEVHPNSFEMDTKHRLTVGKIDCDFSYLYQCIMGTGTVDILSNDSEKLHGLQRIMEHYTQKAHCEFNQKYVDMIQVLKLSVRTWSCKEH